MGQEHKFFLISYEEYEEKGYDGYYSIDEDLSNIVVIYDDIIQYIGDTLAWIPSINPCNNHKKGFGINNYGITLFDKEGASVIVNIARAWADLLSNGTGILKLTGSYYWTTNDKGVSEGKYEMIEVNRDELVKNFRKLQLFSEKVISGSYLMLHFGI
ncbi:hypothetical protein [Clostridium thailandense]|uniref:hypothetical protein n=1 Tax=Clostridium thailandense TaxID=2794346 RepID=UPI003989BF20